MRPRVLAASLGRWVDPAEAYRAVCGGSDAAFWLDSGPHARSGMSYLGVASSVVTEFDGPVLDWLQAELRSHDIDTTDAPSGFALGWVGWLGYELKSQTMGVPATRDSRYPLAAWMRIERALAVRPRPERGDAARTRRPRELARDGGRVARSARRGSAPSRASASATWAYDDDTYLDMIRACQAAIIEGDAYQLCLTTEVSVDSSPDPLTTYLALRESSPPITAPCCARGRSRC